MFTASIIRSFNQCNHPWYQPPACVSCTAAQPQGWFVSLLGVLKLLVLLNVYKGSVNVQEQHKDPHRWLDRGPLHRHTIWSKSSASLHVCHQKPYIAIFLVSNEKTQCPDVTKWSLSMKIKGLKEHSAIASYFFSLLITLRICYNGFCEYRMSCMSGGVTEVTIKLQLLDVGLSTVSLRWLRQGQR